MCLISTSRFFIGAETGCRGRCVVQEQRLARYRGAGGAAVFLFDDAAEPLDGEFAAPHVEQGAYDGAHHVTQESVGRDGEYLLFPLALPAGEGHPAVVGLYVGVQLAEAGKIGVSVELLGRLVHPVEVERAAVAAGKRLEKGRLVVDEVVFVGAAEGVETAVSLSLIHI